MPFPREGSVALVALQYKHRVFLALATDNFSDTLILSVQEPIHPRTRV